MPDRVLIIQNSHEGPGIIPQVLREKRITYDNVILDHGDVIPSPDAYRAIFVLGGPDSANDTSEKMLSELAAIREAVDKGIPVFGICLGCQILVKVAGGQVLPGRRPEIGLRDHDGTPFRVNLTEAGKQDPLFVGLEDSFRVFELHGEVIELTPDIQLLAEGASVKNQIVKINDRCYGTLCHCEVMADEVKDWPALDPMIASIDHAQLIEELKSIEPEYHSNGRKLLENYLRVVGL